MIVRILAPNIRAGGGLTHLVELIRRWQPGRFGIDRLVLEAPPEITSLIKDQPIECINTDGRRSIRGALSRWARLRQTPMDCDVLFAPGGTYLGAHPRFVTLSQNLLPFDREERNRYGGLPKIRLLMLRWLQARSMRRAIGAMFLSEFARSLITKEAGPIPGRTTIVRHGIDDRFRRDPTHHDPTATGETLHVLYVSTVSRYKHQWVVVEGVAKARARGLPLTLTLAGRAEPAAKLRLQAAMKRWDPDGLFARYVGNIGHESVHRTYHAADVFVFASSCENLPNIVLEAMASGLPIISSDRGPMREVLGDAALYFNPEDADELANQLEAIANSRLRQVLAQRAYSRSAEFSWERCANETFAFLSKCAGR